MGERGRNFFTQGFLVRDPSRWGLGHMHSEPAPPLGLTKSDKQFEMPVL